VRLGAVDGEAQLLPVATGVRQHRGPEPAQIGVCRGRVLSGVRLDGWRRRPGRPILRQAGAGGADDRDQRDQQGSA
jgi:hypothetical protein